MRHFNPQILHEITDANLGMTTVLSSDPETFSELSRNRFRAGRLGPRVAPLTYPARSPEGIQAQSFERRRADHTPIAYRHSPNSSQAAANTSPRFASWRC